MTAARPPRSFWTQALPLMGGRVLSSLLNVLLSMFLARMLDLAGMGVYRQFALVCGLSVQAFQLGFTTSILHFVPRSDERTSRAFIGTASIVLTALGAATTLGLVLLAPWLGQRFSSPELTLVATPLALFSGLLIASSPIEAALMARGQSVAAALAQVATEGSRVVLALILTLRWGLSGFAWAFVIVGGIRWLVSLALTLLPSGAFAWAADQVRRQFAFAIPYGLSLIVALAQGQLHLFFAASHISTAAFALYSSACIHLPLMTMFFAAIGDALDVRLAAYREQGQSAAAHAVFADAFHKVMLVAWPLGAAALGAAPQLLTAMYGPQYAGAGLVMRLSILIVLLGVPPTLSVLRAYGKTRTILGLNVVKIAITWPVLALGYRAAGVVGLMGGHVLVEAASRLAQFILAGESLGVRSGQLFDRTALTRVTLASFGIVGVGVAAGTYVASPWLVCGLTGAVTLGVIGLEVRTILAAARLRAAPG